MCASHPPPTVQQSVCAVRAPPLRSVRAARHGIPRSLRQHRRPPRQSAPYGRWRVTRRARLRPPSLGAPPLRSVRSMRGRLPPCAGLRSLLRAVVGVRRKRFALLTPRSLRSLVAPAARGAARPHPPRGPLRRFAALTAARGGVATPPPRKAPTARGIASTNGPRVMVGRCSVCRAARDRPPRAGAGKGNTPVKAASRRSRGGPWKTRAGGAPLVRPVCFPPPSPDRRVALLVIPGRGGQKQVQRLEVRATQLGKTGPRRTRGQSTPCVAAKDKSQNPSKSMVSIYLWTPQRTPVKIG